MTTNQQSSHSGTLRRLAAIAFALDPAEFGELTARFIYYDFDVEPHYKLVDECGPTICFKVSTLSRLGDKDFCNYVEAILEPFDTQIYEWGDDAGINKSLADLVAESEMFNRDTAHADVPLPVESTK